MSREQNLMSLRISAAEVRGGASSVNWGCRHKCGLHAGYIHHQGLFVVYSLQIASATLWTRNQATRCLYAEHEHHCNYATRS